MTAVVAQARRRVKSPLQRCVPLCPASRPVVPAAGQRDERCRRSLRQSAGDHGGAASPPTSWLATPSGSALALVLSTSMASAIFYSCCRNKRRRSLPETKWRTLICRLGKVGAPGCHRRSVISEAEWTRRMDLRIQCGEDNNLWQDRARPSEGAHAACAHVSDRARSLRAMHRLLRALLEAELERWRRHHAQHHGRHEHDLVGPHL